MSFIVEIQDVLIEVTITEDEFQFQLLEDHIDVEISEDHFEVSMVEDVINIDLVEDVIEVTLDDSCICLPIGGPGGTTAIYNCDGTLVSGDFVFISPILDNYVVKASDNNTVNPVMGIVTELLSATTVAVVHSGFFIINSALNNGAKVYVGPNGRPTDTLPDTGYIQILGVTARTGRLYFNPDPQRCKRLEL